MDRSTAVAQRRVTGLSVEVIAGLVAELGPVWADRQRARLTARTRQRAVGGGARYKLVFVDRLLVTLVCLRHGVTHDVLAAWFGVDRSTITRAVNEIRPLLAARGCRVQGGVRLRTLADVIAHLDHTRAAALMDATEIRVRRPTAKRAGRQQFISGKSRTNAVKALVITDAQGKLLFCGATVRGSTADITQARQAGLPDWLTHTSGVQILTDAGYQGLGAQTRGQVITPTLRHHKKALERMPGITELREAQRREHARRRVRVEHGIAHLKNWRSLARTTAAGKPSTPQSVRSQACCPTINTPTAADQSPPSPPAQRCDAEQASRTPGTPSTTTHEVVSWLFCAQQFLQPRMTAAAPLQRP